MKSQIDEEIHDIGERERKARQRVHTKVAMIGHQRQTIEKSKPMSEHGYYTRREDHKRDIHFGF